MAIRLPRLKGRFPVGTVTFDWTDLSRAEALADQPGSHRRIVAELHYPAEKMAGRPAPYVPERVALVHWLATHGWADDEGKRLTDMYGPAPSQSIPEAPLARGETPWPVLLFSPGAYQSRHHYTFVAERLASNGYVVALMSHPFAGLDYFEGMGLVGRHPQWTPTGGVTHDESDAFYEPMSEVLAADASFVVSRIEALVRGRTSLFSGGLDLDRIGIAGHSRAGKIVARASSTDRRFKAALIFDNLPPAGIRQRGLVQPLMLINAVDPGLPEHLRSAANPPRWNAERLQMSRDLVARNPAPAYNVTLTGVGHMNFSDRGFFESARFPSTLGAETALDRIMAYSLAFLDHHLKGLPVTPILAGEKVFVEAECEVGGKEA